MADLNPDGEMVVFQSEDFDGMPLAAARQIDSVIKTATQHIWTAQDGITRTSKGIEAKTQLNEAAAFLMDLHTALRVIIERANADRADALDEIADSETDDPVEYYRLRGEAAALRGGQS